MIGGNSFVQFPVTTVKVVVRDCPLRGLTPTTPKSRDSPLGDPPVKRVRLAWTDTLRRAPPDTAEGPPEGPPPEGPAKGPVVVREKV